MNYSKRDIRRIAYEKAQNIRDESIIDQTEDKNANQTEDENANVLCKISPSGIIVEGENILTRSSRREKVIQIIRELLVSAQNTKSKLNRIKECKKIMDFLIEEKEFVQSYPYFKDTVEKKIIEFANDNVYMPEHYREFFGKELDFDIPHNYRIES